MKKQIKDTESQATLSLPEILELLKSSNVAIVPTETVEGYAVSVNSSSAIKKLMELKDRSFGSGKVFTLVPESIDAIEKYVVLSDKAKTLINNHFPGELTIILNKNPQFKNFYFDHFDSIGIRLPNHPLFEKLLPETGPLLLTSANPRGGTPRTFTGHLPSTIIDLTQTPPKILRQGNLRIDHILDS